jgi:two-component system sensor histidine kinase UhpB
MGRSLRVLLVEDAADDAELVLRALARAGMKTEHRRVETRMGLEHELAAFRPDVVLCDFSMPKFGGMEALTICRRSAPEVPFLLVSGAIGEQVAVSALKEGADDYVMKTNLSRLGPAIEGALREAGTRRARAIAEAGLRRAQSMAKLAHIVTGSDGRFENWSETLPLIAGVNAQRLPRSTREWLELVHPDDRPLFRQRAIEAGRKRERAEVEYRLQVRDGAAKHLRQTMEPLDDQAQGRWFNTLQDVSEQKRAELHLAAMAQRLVTLQEKERRDIARELHDRIGQNLSALSINLARLRTGPAQPAGADLLADCLSLVEATGLAIQNVLTELKPPMLASYGLVDALGFHAREFTRRTGITVDVRGDQGERLRPEVEMALFRIAQAALTNVAQHAKAHRVSIALRRADGRFGFEISDDGVGFDAERARAAGRWGLTAMRERAEAIDGTLRIESVPGRGARIIVEAPS